MKTKLLYITNGINGPGGLERVLSIKASYLADHYNYEVYILTLNQGSAPLFYQFSDKVKFHDIEARGGGISYLINYRKGLKNTVKAINPDIISVCDDGLKGFFVPYLLKRDKAIVYERHASKNIFKKKDSLTVFDRLKFKFLEYIMLFGGRKYSSFIVLTNENVNEWRLSNLKVIPNPLSYVNVERSSLDNKKVISVGNHGFQKGYDRLLQSWKLVVDKYPNWSLEIYGNKKGSQSHYELAQKLGIKDKVTFFDPIKNIQDKYKEASIYVMPSRSEGFGMVLIEAMAHGVPCISYDCPSGPSDIISNNEDGYLINNGDIKEMSNKIIKLIEHDELRKSMGKKASQNALRYLPDVIIPQWDRLFESLIND